MGGQWRVGGEGKPYAASAGAPLLLPLSTATWPHSLPLLLLLPHRPADAKRRDEYLQRLMGPPIATWRQIIDQAKQNVEVLKQAEVIRNVQNILQVCMLSAGEGR